MVFGVVAFIKDTDDSDVSTAKHNTQGNEQINMTEYE